MVAFFGAGFSSSLALDSLESKYTAKGCFTFLVLGFFVAYFLVFHVRNRALPIPLVIGHGATIGDGAQLRGSVILPESTVPRETLLVGGVAGPSRTQGRA